jgi:hypothetical protein
VCFDSTYLSKSGFSTIKILKSKYRSSLADKHLNDCMRVAFTKYTPNYNKRAEDRQCQVSHSIPVIKGECMFRFYSSESGFSTVKMLKSKYRSSLTDKHLNDCMRVSITKYTPNYNKLAEEMQHQVLL